MNEATHFAIPHQLNLGASDMLIRHTIEGLKL